MAKREKFLGMSVRDLDEEPTKAASEEVKVEKAEDAPAKEVKKSNPEISPEAKSDKTFSKKYKVDGTDLLNVRRAADSTAPILRVISRDKIVEGDLEDGWVHLKEGGYCMIQFLSEVK
jgi:hypothetical protein